MDVVAYLEAVREQYLNRFEETAAEARQRYGEVKLEANIFDPEMELPRRFDLMYRQDGAGRIEDVRLRTDVEWPDAVVWHTGGIPVTVLSIAWDCCVVIAKPAPRGQAIAQIVSWYSKWLDDTRAPAEPPFRGVVHSIEPQEVDGVLLMRVDLGTAPADALLELLQILATNGVQAAALGTTDPAEPARPTRAVFMTG